MTDERNKIMVNLDYYNDLQTVGGRLKRVREIFYDLSQKDFAEHLNISLKTYQNYEKNKTPIPHSVLLNLDIDGLDISLDWLIKGTGSIAGGDFVIVCHDYPIKEYPMDDDNDNIEDVMKRLFFNYINKYIFIERNNYPKYNTEESYINEFNKYDKTEKLICISVMLNIDVNNSKSIPYQAIYEYSSALDSRLSEWFLKGTINQIKYTFYEVFEKRLYLNENNLYNSIIKNLKYASENFLKKLDLKLKSLKENENDFF